MSRQSFQLTLLVLLFYQVASKIDVTSETFPCNLTNEKIWNIYYEHLTASRNIELKVLTSKEEEDNDVIDFTNSITSLINSLELTSRLEFFTKPKNQTSANVLPPINVRYTTANYAGITNYTFTSQIFFKELQDVCIIIVHDEQHLLNYLQSSETDFFESTRKRYIIVFTNKGVQCSPYSNVIPRLLVKLWKDKRILNAIASTPCTCHYDNFYIYKPFIKIGDKERGIVEVQSGYGSKKHPSLLINEPRNLHGMPLKVSLFGRNVSLLFKRPRLLKHSPIYKGKGRPKYYGVDGMVLHELAKYMNFKINVDDKKTYYGTIMNNGTVTGSLGKVMRKEVEFAANFRFIEYYHPDFEYGNPVLSDKLCIIVPISPQMPQFLIILTCFDIISWICIFTIIFLCMLIWHVHNKIRNRTDGGFIEIYSMIMGTSVKITKKFRLSVLVIVCSFANIIFGNMFQGILYSHFSKITYFKNIDTLDEFIRRNLSISTSLRQFFEIDSDTHQALRNRVIDTSDKHQSAIYDVAFYKNTSILERFSDAKLLVQKQYLDEEGNPRLYLVKECLNTYLLAYIFPRDSPYKHYFNYVITKLAESGLTKKWIGDIYEAVKNGKNHTSYEKKQENWRMLNNNDFQAAYIVFVTGNIIAIFCFLGEIFVQQKLRFWN